MVLKAIKKRKSVRHYQKKEIPEDLLQEILEAGRLAPSAKNQQDYKLILVKDKILKEKMIQACGNRSYIGEASIIIAGCATNTSFIMPNGIYSYPIDLAIVLDHISLQAADLGLGTCWIGGFDQERVKEILHIPDDVVVVCLLTLGYTAGNGFEKSRKALEDIICSNYFRV